mmetsp:Transcript_103193/g.300958  ORF Transcript_103193/g.300958 Transcript_103193/m.300958 type:complete len:376 (-) Transcript_103193:2034-3161(-)
MVGSLRVDKDRVRVAVDDVQLQLLLHHGDGALQSFTALGGDEGGERLRVEAAVLEAQAAVHGVGGELQRLLPDLERLQPLGVALGLDGRLDVPAAVHQPPEHLRQHALLGGAVRQVGLADEVRLGGALWHLLLVGPVDGGEADVVLLDDRGVEAVEVQEHDELVVEPHLGLQHQASAVGRLAAAPGRRRLLLVPPVRVVQARAEACALHLHAALLRKHVLAVGQDELLPVELVAQEHLVALRALVLKRGVPKVSREVCQLPGERQDLQRVHELHNAQGALECHVSHVTEGLGRVVKLWEILRLNGLQRGHVELVLCKVGQVVGSQLWQQIPGLQQHVTNKAASCDVVANPEACPLPAFHPWKPLLRPTQSAQLLP